MTLTSMLPIYSFLLAPLKMVALTTSRIHLMIYLIYITHIDKRCDYVGVKIKSSVQTDWLCSTGRGGVNYKVETSAASEPLIFCIIL